MLIVHGTKYRFQTVFRMVYIYKIQENIFRLCIMIEYNMINFATVGSNLQ
jgi:hypothetical protein